MSLDDVFTEGSQQEEENGGPVKGNGNKNETKRKRRHLFLTFGKIRAHDRF